MARRRLTLANDGDRQRCCGDQKFSHQSTSLEFEARLVRAQQKLAEPL
jgi:hypothetical protein